MDVLKAGTIFCGFLSNLTLQNTYLAPVGDEWLSLITLGFENFLKNSLHVLCFYLSDLN